MKNISSKDIKKFISILCKIAAMLCGIIVINKIMTFILVDDATDEFRTSMYQLYNQENVDVLFLGSSHVFCGVNANVLSEELGKDVYLAATSVQKPDTSYYILKEAIAKYDIEMVCLDMFYNQYKDEPEDRDVYSTSFVYGVADYIKNPITRAKLIINACPTEEYIHGFFPASRYGGQVLDLEYIEQIIKSKRSSEYFEQLMNGYDAHGSKSSVTSVKPHSQIYISDEETYNAVYDMPISNHSYKYLDKIVKLCNKNNIKLVLFATPMTDMYLASTGNYDTYYQEVSEYAQKNNLEYFDFSLYKGENSLESAYPEELFLDGHHLNGEGSIRVSADIADVLAKTDESLDLSSEFYENFSDKMDCLSDTCFGMVLHKLEQTDEAVRYEIVPVSNCTDMNLVYQVIFRYNEEVQTNDEQQHAEKTDIVIQDYSDNTVFELGEDLLSKEGATIVVYSNDANSGEEVTRGKVPVYK